MIYKEFQGMKLSALGMGCMRLPIIDGANEKIDEELTARMVKYAFDHGINYFDTAWGYHEGNSETVMGSILKDYDRDRFYLASKFPGFERRLINKVEQVFEKQLEKCDVEYFDFYLFHNVCELSIDGYLDPANGIFDYLMKQKEAGHIRHLGFSTHGTLPTIKRFLEAYGKDMEFGQIELNYFDWEFQDAKGKVELLNEWNIPIWVMEPVRGGQLAVLSREAEEKLKAARPDEKTPAWAFRFLQGIPNIVMTLSGMSDLQQMVDNVATYEEEKPLNKEEREMILSIADEMIKAIAVPCTGCRYCVSYCPMGLDIPELLRLYNESKAKGTGDFIVPMAMAMIDKEKRPAACIACGSCANVCPQKLKIPDIMMEFAEKIRNRK
ncbi:MAG: aldo/keto reductase [Lachnospiraceae bacterium]|jgi:predicted aldo/keto reductase-like oxidoreductase